MEWSGVGKIDDGGDGGERKREVAGAGAVIGVGTVWEES